MCGVSGGLVWPAGPQARWGERAHACGLQVQPALAMPLRGIAPESHAAPVRAALLPGRSIGRERHQEPACASTLIHLRRLRGPFSRTRYAPAYIDTGRAKGEALVRLA